MARIWVPVLAGAAAFAALDRRSDAGDLLYFVHRGKVLLSSEWSAVYAQRELQSGPLQLLFAGAARSTEVLAFVVEIGVAALLLFVLRSLGVAGRWRLLAGFAALAAGLPHAAFVEGHPAEALTPLLWVLAALEARRGRTLRAGGLIGISAGLELWGLLGAAVLLLAPRVRDAMRGFTVAGAVIGAQLAPFVLFGTFRMFDYEWRLTRGTAISFVVPAGTHFGWPLRLLQAAVACGLGALLARRLRASVHAVWIVPLSVALARILLDPVSFGWYWLEVEALALVGAALLVTAPPLRVSGALGRTTAVPPRAASPPTRAHS